MIEHVYKPNLSDCLKSKRIAQNEVNPERVVFSCKKSKGSDRDIHGPKKRYLKYYNNGKYFDSFSLALYGNIYRIKG